MLKIRRYRPEDNKVVKELHFAGIEQMRGDPLVAKISRPASHDADLDDIERVYFEGGDFIVGLEGDEIVAMGAFKKRSPECAELKRLRTRPDKQRKGYGEQISKKLIELAKKMGYTEAFLDTLTTNYRSQALAEKLGFKETGRGMRGPYHLIYYEKKLE